MWCCAQHAYDLAIGRIKNAGMQFRESGGGSAAGPGLRIPEKGGVSAPLGPGQVRLMPIVCVAASQAFSAKGHSRLIRVSRGGAECGPSGAKLKPSMAYAAATEYTMDAAKFASGVDDLLPIQVHSQLHAPVPDFSIPKPQISNAWPQSPSPAPQVFSAHHRSQDSILPCTPHTIQVFQVSLLGSTINPLPTTLYPQPSTPKHDAGF